MSYAKLGMAALAGAAAYGMSRGQGRRADFYTADEREASYRDEKKAQALRDKALREGDLAVRAFRAGKHKQSEKHWATASRLEKEARALSVKWAGR